MVRTHPSTVNRFHGAPAHTVRPRFASARPNAPAMGAAEAPAHAMGMVAAALAGLGALPFCGSYACHLIETVSPDACTAMLLNALFLFALVAGAVTSLCGIACGLGNLLDNGEA